MEQVSTEIQRFFEEYERCANQDDAGRIGSQFAEVFMTADPSGTRVVSTESLVAGVSKRKRLFESLGSRSTTLVSLKQKDLNDRYVLAETEWLVRFDREEVGELSLRSSFVMHRSNDGLKIVFYLMHQNPMVVLKERGLLAPEKVPV